MMSAASLFWRPAHDTAIESSYILCFAATSMATTGTVELGQIRLAADVVVMAVTAEPQAHGSIGVCRSIRFNT